MRFLMRFRSHISFPFLNNDEIFDEILENLMRFSSLPELREIFDEIFAEIFDEIC